MMVFVVTFFLLYAVLRAPGYLLTIVLLLAALTS